MHVRIDVGALHQRRQLQRGVGDDRVTLVRPVEGDSGDPVGDLVGHCFQIVEIDRPDRVSHVATQPFTSARSRIGARSSPVGMVPNAPPQWPASRVARNASATAGCPWRTSSDPCSARQMSSATLRARYWMVSRSPSCCRRFSTWLSSRTSWPYSGQLVEQDLDAFGTSCHGAQRIQRADVTRALPDAHQRRLTVQPRHAGSST